MIPKICLKTVVLKKTILSIIQLGRQLQMGFALLSWGKTLQERETAKHSSSSLGHISMYTYANKGPVIKAEEKAGK